jgi:predicted esterase
VAAPAVPTVQPEKRAETADKPAEKGPVDVQVRLNALVETWKQNGGTSPKLWEIARELSGSGDARIIPTMIGVIDADQSYNTVYGLGYFGLSTITGVKYSAFHDGAWWRRWWEASKQRFPEAAGIAIPEYPKTEFAAKYVPFPADLDTYDGLIRKLLADYPNAKESNTDMSHIAEQLVRINNPRAIPVLIGVIDADNSYATVYGLGYFGLGRMTDVAYSPFHDGAWWRRWWEANKQRYHAAAGEAIPEYPKTAHGAKYVAYPADQDTYDGLIRKLLGDYARAAASDLNLSDIAQELVRINDPRAIPVLIGVIDADNSYATVYGLGYFGLGRMTKVSYSPYHDGAWWRRWWEANKEKYPEAARNTPIPELAKTEHGKAYVPMPESFETLDGKVGWLREGLAAGRPVQWMQIAEALASHNDARAIPVMIGIIEGENTEATIYGVGYFGLSKLAGVKYDKSHDGAWWRRWWEENKGGLPREAQDVAIPDFKELIAGWAKGAAGRERAEVEARFTGYPAEKVAIGGDAKKTYFLIGPAQAQKPPEKGWKLLLILPGGDGGEAFHPFCRSIHKEALPEGYVAAELVAHAWSKDENRTVWPTGKMNRDGAEFTTEEFIKDVVADVSRRMKVDSSKVYALGWSSSGPALYCDSLQGSPITGYFIAMSVFRTQWMGDIAGAKGKKYYILHSPDDKMIPIAQHAREAERKLREAGAEAVVTEYAGGHGWTEDPFGNIRKGIVWLEGR